MYLCLQWIFNVLCGASFGAFIVSKNEEFLLISCILLLISNLIFSAKKAERICFLFFNLTVFFFILGRPTIQMFTGVHWWPTGDGVYGSRESLTFALMAILISLLFLRLGVIVAEVIFRNRPCLWKQKYDQEQHVNFIKNLRLIALFAFTICALCDFAVGLEKLLYMRGKDYVDYFTNFSSQLPSFVQSFATMARFTLCIFLATFPSKKMAFGPLAAYLLLSVPVLVVGVRNETLLRCLFVFLYYFIRDILDGRHKNGRRKWIGRIETSLIIVVVPAILLFSSVYGYVREDRDVTADSPLAAVRDLVVEQGVTFRVMGNAYDVMPKLQTKHFVFGPFIDAAQHGLIARGLFDATSEVTNNSVIRATEYHDFSHSMSYAVLGERYLEGHGLGSSYILEAYADGGYIGIALFSFALGIILVGLLYLLKKNWLTRIFALLSLTSIFFIPRAGALSWLMFTMSKSFWFILLACFVMAKLAGERYERFSPLQKPQKAFNF